MNMKKQSGCEKRSFTVIDFVEQIFFLVTTFVATVINGVLFHPFFVALLSLFLFLFLFLISLFFLFLLFLSPFFSC